MSIEYLNYILTGKWGLSPSMGTPFYLLDQEKGEYSELLLNKFGISKQQLPPIMSKGTVLGTVDSDIGYQLGLKPDTKIVLGSFDHPSCATGAGVYGFDEVLLSCGTSWVEFFPMENRKKAIKYIAKKLKLDTKEAGKIYEEWRYDYVREIKYPLY